MFIQFWAEISNLLTFRGTAGSPSYPVLLMASALLWVVGTGDEEGRKGKEQVFFHVRGLTPSGHLGSWTSWLKKAWAPV